MPMSRRFYGLLLLIFVLALGLRLALVRIQYTSDLRNYQSGDYTLYRIGGEYIRDEGDLSNSLFLLRTPLFPLLVAALRVDGLAVLLANVLIGASLAPLAVILARQLGLKPEPALIAGFITALDPASIGYSAWLGTEPLTNLMLILMCIALLQGIVYSRGRAAVLWSAAAGLALVLSVLSRPAPYLLWIGLSVALLIVYRRQWLPIAVYALVSVLGIGAWVVHNGVLFDNYTVSSVGAYSMLYYRAASVEHWATGHDMPTVYTDLSRRVEERLGHDTSQVDSHTRDTHYAGSSRLTNAMTAVAVETFIDHPAQYLFTIPIGLGRMYGFSSILPSWTLPFEILWNSVFLLGTAAGLWLSFRHKAWLLFWAALLLIGYFTVGTLVAQTSGMDTRMRTMLTPFMAALCAYALDLWRFSRQQKGLQ